MAQHLGLDAATLASLRADGVIAGAEETWATLTLETSDWEAERGSALTKVRQKPTDWSRISHSGTSLTTARLMFLHGIWGIFRLYLYLLRSVSSRRLNFITFIEMTEEFTLKNSISAVMNRSGKDEGLPSSNSITQSREAVRRGVKAIKICGLSAGAVPSPSASSFGAPRPSAPSLFFIRCSLLLAVVSSP